MITTTLNRIYACSPYESSWNKLLSYLGKTKPDDEPLPYAVIVESNGLAYAQWAMQCEPQHALMWQRYAIWCARRVTHFSTDPRVTAALDAAEGYLDGTVSIEKLKEAAAAAKAAAVAAAWAAKAAACAAAARTEAGAAWAEAGAAWAEAWAAKAAAVAEAEARDAELNAQRTEFLRIVS